MASDNPADPQIRPGALILEVKPRTLSLTTVTRPEIEGIASAGKAFSIYSAISTALFASALSIALAWLASPPAGDLVKGISGTLVALFIVVGLISLAFSFNQYKKYNSAIGVFFE